LLLIVIPVGIAGIQSPGMAVLVLQPRDCVLFSSMRLFGFSFALQAVAVLHNQKTAIKEGIGVLSADNKA
jgi:hypothetical protein